MSSENVTADTDGAGEAAPGVVLAQAREEIGVSQREVAEALNLPIHVVAAIEEGDKSNLPSHVFTRGYVRAYAKLLELDPDPLVAALALGEVEASFQSPSVSSTVATSPLKLPFKLPFDMPDPRIFAGIIGGVVLLVLLLALLGGEDTDQNPPIAGPASDTQPAAASEAEVPIGQEQAAVQEQAAQLSAAPQDTQDLDAVAAAVGESGESSEDAEASEASPADGGDEQARRLTPVGNDRLSLSFSEDCWVSIKDEGGGVLFSNLGRAGDTLEFVGAAPFTVLLGYAHGVVLRYNHEIVALGPHTRNNVATLVLAP